MKEETSPQQNSISDKMMESFANLQNKNEMAEVLKELFDDNKIKMMTDLTHDEIKLVTRLNMIADMKDIKIYKDGLGLYMQLLLSKNRKSRREILEAIKGYVSDGGFLGKLNPFNRNKGV